MYAPIMQAEVAQPDRIPATPARIAHLVERLGGRDAAASVLTNRHQGQLAPGSQETAVMVGDVEVVVPSNAQITVRTRGTVPGIDVNSDNMPAPPGTWIWIGCDAVRHCHEIFAELTSI